MPFYLLSFSGVRLCLSLLSLCLCLHRCSSSYVIIAACSLSARGRRRPPPPSCSSLPHPLLSRSLATHSFVVIITACCRAAYSHTAVMHLHASYSKSLKSLFVCSSLSHVEATFIIGCAEWRQLQGALAPLLASREIASFRGLIHTRREQTGLCYGPPAGLDMVRKEDRERERETETEKERQRQRQIETD